MTATPCEGSYSSSPLRQLNHQQGSCKSQVKLKKKKKSDCAGSFVTLGKGGTPSALTGFLRKVLLVGLSSI